MPAHVKILSRPEGLYRNQINSPISISSDQIIIITVSFSLSSAPEHCLCAAAGPIYTTRICSRYYPSHFLNLSLPQSLTPGHSPSPSLYIVHQFISQASSNAQCHSVTWLSGLYCEARLSCPYPAGETRSDGVGDAENVLSAL